MALKTGATLVSRLPLIVAEMPSNIDGAVKKGAEMIADRARSNAPVGTGAERGEPTIRESIYVVPVDPGELGRRQNAASKEGNDLGIATSIVNDTTAYSVEVQARSPKRRIPYALMVEFGTESGAQGPNIRQPFLLPAFFELEQEVVDVIADELKAI